MGELLWALWVFAGGRVHGGYLEQPYVAAYFKDVKECERVAALIRPQARGAQCIQATYVLVPPKSGAQQP